MNQPQHFIRLFLVYSLLVLLPVIATAFVTTQIINSLILLEDQETLENLTGRSELIGASAHSESFFKPIFNEYVRRYFENKPEQLDKFNRIAHEFNQIASTSIDAFAFSENGTMIECDSSPAELRSAIAYIWEYLNSEVTTSSYGNIKPDLQKFFGRDFHPRRLRKMRNQIFSFIAGNKPGMIFYSRKREPGEEGMRGLLLIVRDLPSHDEILDKSLQDFLQAEIRLAIIPAAEKDRIISKDKAPHDFVAIQKEMQRQNLDILSYQGFIWKKTSFNDFAIIAGQKQEKQFYELGKYFVLLLALLISGLGLLAALKNLNEAGRLWISIRLKLIAVFVFAVYLPLLGLFFLSFKGLQDRRAVLENEARKGMLDALYKLDSDFSRKEDEIKNTFDRFFQDHTWQKKLSSDWYANDKIIRRHAKVGLEGENFFNWLEIRNGRLEQLFCTAKGEANNRIKDLNRVMAQISLEKFVPQLISREAKRIRQSDFIIRNIIENPVLGFSHYFEVPGQIVPMEFEGSFLYWYWNYYPDPVDGVVFFSANTKAQYNVVKYLARALSNRFSFNNVQLKIISYHPTEQKWLPESQEIARPVEMISRIGAINGRITSSQLEIDGQAYLATCFPGIKMRDVFLTCLYPIREINAKIASMRNQIFLGMFLIIIVAVLTGLLLTRAFLHPIAELNSGLNALRQRQTDYRVNIASSDEFGTLGETFNQMMIEVKEMLLAEAVQQCLIPTSPPQIPGYELIVFNQMATSVGGDYADAFLLPDGKFLLVLGDVTGHGVSSSILTAMVKALVFRFSQHPGDLSQIMKDLSHMIFELLKHRKLMTFCAVIVHQNSGSFDLTNAGHPFPLLCDRNGICKMIEHNSLPLGVSKKRSNYPASTGRLEVGDFLLLYTDGIAEAANRDGEMFGFDRVQSIVAQNSHLSANELKEELLKQFWAHYTEEHLDDDLTFVILKRSAAEPNA